MIDAFLGKFYKYIIFILIFILMALLLWMNHIQSKLDLSEANCTTQIQQIEKNQLETIRTQQANLITAQEKVRVAEQKSAQQVSEIESKLHEQNIQASTSQTKLINDIRSGTVGLYERFTCPSTTSDNSNNSVPKSATSLSGDNAASKRGLQREDAEFLISESNRADQVVRQLSACQALLKQERSNEKAL